MWKVGGGHCNHISLIFYPRRWQITSLKWCMLTKQIPAEKCSHSKTSSSREGKERVRNGQPFHLCAFTLLCQLKLDLSWNFSFVSTWHYFINCLWPPAKSRFFSPKLWDYLTLNLLLLDLVSYLLFDGLIECNYYVETIKNSLIFFSEMGWGVLF